jgi:hypothetical protein
LSKDARRRENFPALPARLICFPIDFQGFKDLLFGTVLAT